ncbi:hypothetical protein C8Q77DRAFT_1144629 [Trametes polyzona]|nr:hypothetical protein C8Q77DRAFT_1144629 [Trametes polyzona]
MHDYFDGVNSYKDGEYGCGVYKRECMHSGRILLSTKDDQGVVLRTQLLITFPPSDNSPKPRAHPVNAIIRKTLSWLTAHYSLSEEDYLAGDAPATTSQAPLTAAKAFDFNGRTGGLRSQADESIEKPLHERLRIAAHLKTHADFLDLLQDQLMAVDEWPEADKTADQFPKGGYKRDADPQSPAKDAQKQRSVQATASHPGSSLKRPLADEERPVEQPQLKRSKSNPRRSTRLRARRSG